MILTQILQSSIPNFSIYSFVSPSDELTKGLKLEKELRSKRHLNIELTENEEENFKKLEHITFEGRRIKYFQDSTTAIIITFLPEMKLKWLKRLVQICSDEKFNRWWFDKNKLIIEGEKPRFKEKQPALLYL
jgi:hypothetical protein